MPVDTTTPAHIERFVGRAGQLYSLPRVTMQVLELTDRPDPDKQALKSCIETDPALTSKLLRVVNSSLFGLTKRVGDLHQAISLLGVKPLKLLVLGFSLPEGLFHNLAGEFLSRYWQHSLVRAVAAPREIAQQAWRLPGDDIFVAGLLQDLGVLVLAQELGAAYVDFVERMHACQADVREMERQTLGFDHAELTARLLTQWQLPASIVHCALPPDSFAALELLENDERLGPHILHLADRLALLLVERRTDLAGEVRAVASRVHGLDDARLLALVGGVQAKLKPLAQVFLLELPEGVDYRDVLAQAQRQMVDVATDAALLMSRHQNACASNRSLPETVALAQAAEACFSSTYNPSRPRPATRESVAIPKISDSDISPALFAAAAACRQSRQPLALAILELDNQKDLPLLAGPGGWELIVAEAARQLAAQEFEGAQQLRLGDARWALILPDCDRLTAARWGRDLVVAFREACAPRWPKSRPTLSIGLAAVPLPPRNFNPQELQKRAEQCLSGVQSSGGNCLKSVEI